MCHQAQKGFCGVFIGITQHQKGYLVYVPSTMKAISSYDVVSDEYFSNVLAYIPRPYSEAMAIPLSVSYIPCATSSKEQTGDIITFAQFEEGIYNLKLVKMQKEMTNKMTIQLCQHYSVKKKWMQWILEMSQMMNLCLRKF